MLRGQNLAEDISIHAPRVGSDRKIAQFFACNFAQK